MTRAPDTSVERPPVAPQLQFPELQGQRGLAALTIVVFHAYQYDRSGPDARFPLEGTWAHPLLFGLDGMVDWFFVLSAFLLTLPYARALAAGRTLQPAGQFLGRRAVRIVPLYLVATLVVWASRNPTLPGDWRDLVEHLTFTQVYDEQRIFYTIGPAWSLAVEVQFYVLVALLGVALQRWAVRRATPAARLRPLVGAVVVLAVLSLAWSVVAHAVLDRPLSAYPYWYSLPPKLVVFAVGMALAVVVAVRRRMPSAGTAWLLRGAGLVVVVVAAYARESTGLGDVVFHTACALGFGAVVYAGARDTTDSRWDGLVARGPLPWVGLVSYSLYLWHEPLLLQLASWGLLPEQSADAFGPTVLVLLPLSLLVAWASYWVVEHPTSNLRFFMGDRQGRELKPEWRVAP